VPSIEITFEEERETKNTVRFQEIVSGDETPTIGTLYVQKAAVERLGFNGSTGRRVHLTLEAA
jgi:hypothetical protein